MSAKSSSIMAKSAMVADKVNKRTSYRRGRRERRGAGEEKEKGLLRAFDCVFKS